MPSTRKPWIGGNWKCNGNVQKVTALCDTLKQGATFDPNKIDVVVFPPSLHVQQTAQALNSTKKIQTGVQNICHKGYGAYTGEQCIEMVKDIECTWTLIGHSERRQLFHETDEEIAFKVEACQTQKLKCAICIGETLQQRESGNAVQILTAQIKAFLPYIKDWSLVVIAYEPVWAIGTGLTASPDVAQSMHQTIRQYIVENGKVNKDAVRIVYGGSVNAKNADELAKEQDIDGFLVGGASLNADFLKIIQSCVTQKI